MTVRTATLVCLATATAAMLRAAPTDVAIASAMKLPDAPNYSWSTTVDDDARSYVIDGQTNRADKGDLSLVNMPMVATVRRRVSRATTNSDNETPAIFTGDVKYVIQTPDGWRKPSDLKSSSSDSVPGVPGGGGPWGMGGLGMRRSRHGMGMGMGGSGISYPSGERSDENGQPPKAYSNLQSTLSRPHEEIAIIVANYTDLKMDGDIVSGTLSDLGAKLLLVHPGQKEITPLKGAGTFRLWVKDGALVKYELKLEGTLAVNANGTRREVEVHQTATTELKNVGTTKFDVPEEARKRLGA